MTIYYNHTHNREICAACARQRVKWGPDDSCGRVHELKDGDKVRIRGGKTTWTVDWISSTLVTVVRPRKDRFGRMTSSQRQIFANVDRPKRDGDRWLYPITDLVPVTE